MRRKRPHTSRNRLSFSRFKKGETKGGGGTVGVSVFSDRCVDIGSDGNGSLDKIVFPGISGEGVYLLRRFDKERGNLILVEIYRRNLGGRM